MVGQTQPNIKFARPKEVNKFVMFVCELLFLNPDPSLVKLILPISG